MFDGDIQFSLNLGTNLMGQKNLGGKMITSLKFILFFSFKIFGRNLK